MAKYVQRGEVLNFANSTEAKIKAGDVVLLGGKVAIAATDIEVGAIGAVSVAGVFEFDKASGAVTIGAALYYDADNDNVTTTASGPFVGYAVEAKESADETVCVNLAQAPVTGGFTAVTTADATDATTVIALANANKTALNAVIAALNAAAGITD